MFAAYDRGWRRHATALAPRFHLVSTSTFIWYRPLLARVAPVLATAVGTYSDSKMLVSALVLALATVTGLSLPDAGWLPIWESRRRACTSMSPV